MSTGVLDEAAYRRALRALCRAEPRFAGVVERYGPPPFWQRAPGFATLAILMLEQQVSLSQARAMYKRIENAGGVTSSNVARLGEEGLRGLGVTRQKAAYLSALAAQLLARKLRLSQLDAMPDDEAIEALDALHGVGPWTAHCYLLFALRRPDVFPAADIGLMQSVRELWNLRERPSSDAMERRSQAWRPHRATAARLLWHHYLCERGRTVPV